MCSHNQLRCVQCFADVNNINKPVTNAFARPALDRIKELESQVTILHAALFNKIQALRRVSN